MVDREGEKRRVMVGVGGSSERKAREVWGDNQREGYRGGM